MKSLLIIAFAGGVFAAASVLAPAMAQQRNSGSGTVNIWSSAQGTSNSYGAANGYSTSSSGATGNAIGRNSLSHGMAGGLTSAVTTSNANISSYGSGYAQTQTSGYAGGSVAGYSSHGR